MPARDAWVFEYGRAYDLRAGAGMNTGRPLFVIAADRGRNLRNVPFGARS
jgi:hypothetical protein